MIVSDGGFVHFSNRYTNLSIYEIYYPQSKSPLLTQIAQLDFRHHLKVVPVHLLSDTLIFRDFRLRDTRIVFSDSGTYRE